MKQVLYVEDSVTAQLLMRKCIGGLCEVLIVSTLEAAGRLLDERHFDLVITDFLFPEGDALELIERVRRTHPRQKLPIVVVSASMDRMLVSRVLKAGANEALPKPLITDKFRQLVERMFVEPYVRSQKAVVNGVICFQWQVHGDYHQYCPELNLVASGSTKAEAAHHMKALLQAHSEKGAPLGAVAHEGIVTHMVDEHLIAVS